MLCMCVTAYIKYCSACYFLAFNHFILSWLWTRQVDFKNFASVMKGLSGCVKLWSKIQTSRLYLLRQIQASLIDQCKLKAASTSTYLPCTNAGNSLTKWSLKGEAKLKGITANLNEIVDQSTKCCHGECRWEKNYISQLNKHFQVICECSIILQHRKMTTNVLWYHSMYKNQQMFHNIPAWCSDIKCSVILQHGKVDLLSQSKHWTYYMVWENYLTRNSFVVCI